MRSYSHLFHACGIRASGRIRVQAHCQHLCLVAASSATPLLHSGLAATGPAAPLAGEGGGGGDGASGLASSAEGVSPFAAGGTGGAAAASAVAVPTTSAAGNNTDATSLLNRRTRC